MNLEEYAVEKIKALEWENKGLKRQLELSGDIELYKKAILEQINRVPVRPYDSQTSGSLQMTSSEWVKQEIIGIIKAFK